MHDKVKKHWAGETERARKELGRYDLSRAVEVALAGIVAACGAGTRPSNDASNNSPIRKRRDTVPPDDERVEHRNSRSASDSLSRVVRTSSAALGRGSQLG